MHSAGKPVWQQLTALVSLGASGAVTGFTFTPRAPADLTSPTSLPVHLLAMAKAAKADTADDAPLRSAIVNFAQHFLRMAQGKTPAQMEAIIWQHDSVDGVDHGQSCAAFASLTLELAAQAVGQHSWVTGGTSYPWPLHKWVDARVDPNSASPGITSVLQDAKAHHRWHPLGDGYLPQPGDWVLFPGHIEVVTRYAGGVLYTIGGDSLPDFSVNAHQYHDPLGAALGVTGFVNNGDLSPAAGLGGHPAARARGHQAGRARQPAPAATTDPPAAAAGPAAVAGPPTVTAGIPAVSGAPAPAAAGEPAPSAGDGLAPAAGDGPAPATTRTEPTVAANGVVMPGLPALGPSWSGPGRAGRGASHRHHPHAGAASPVAGPGLTANPVIPGVSPAGRVAPRQDPELGTVPIPGLPIAPLRLALGATRRSHHASAASLPVQGTPAQQAFIDEVAPGAVAAQRRYGVPASVTIAQAIMESGWGQSQLATQDHNLFGIKGTGPAGSMREPSWEYVNGQAVMQNSAFRVYRSAAESIDDHGKLLANSAYYRRTMSFRRDPNAFATSLTGIYATDPEYGSKLISLMRRYNLYRYDVTPASRPAPPDSRSVAAGPVPPVTPPAPATPPVTSPPPTAPPPTAPPHTAPPETAPPVTPVPAVTPAPTPPGPAVIPPAGPGSVVTQQPLITLPARPGSVIRPQPVVTLPADPGPVVTPPASRPTPAAHPTAGIPVTQQPGVTFPVTRGAAVTQPGAPRREPTVPSDAGPGVTTPATSRPAATRPGGHRPAATGPATRHPVSYPPASQPQPYQAPPTPQQGTGAPPGTPVESPRPNPGPTALQPGIAPPVAAPPVSVQPAGSSPASAHQPAGVPAAGQSAAGQTTAQVRYGPGPPAPPARTPVVTTRAVQFRHHIPLPVRHAFTTTARATLLRAEPLYRDVASDTGIDWQLLAACDWMQCEAHPRHSPVRGERLGTLNPDGTTYRTKSAALAQCAQDLVELAMTVYGIDLTAPGRMSVRDLASAFAAFRWGGLLRLHHTSAMEFPYSVAGLTDQHTSMRWPDIADPNTPDKPGSRFRRPFGAVPIVLSLNLPATA